MLMLGIAAAPSVAPASVIPVRVAAPQEAAEQSVGPPRPEWPSAYRFHFVGWWCTASPDGAPRLLAAVRGLAAGEQRAPGECGARRTAAAFLTCTTGVRLEADPELEVPVYGQVRRAGCFTAAELERLREVVRGRPRAAGRR